MKQECKFCERPAIAKGLCNTHYRSEKTKMREAALKAIIERADAIRRKRPDLDPVLMDLTKDARMLFREFQEKPPTPQAEIAALRAEMAELRASIKPSKSK